LPDRSPPPSGLLPAHLFRGRWGRWSVASERQSSSHGGAAPPFSFKECLRRYLDENKAELSEDEQAFLQRWSRDLRANEVWSVINAHAEQNRSGGLSVDEATSFIRLILTIKHVAVTENALIPSCSAARPGVPGRRTRELRLGTADHLSAATGVKINELTAHNTPISPLTTRGPIQGHSACWYQSVAVRLGF